MLSGSLCNGTSVELSYVCASRLPVIGSKISNSISIKFDIIMMLLHVSYVHNTQKFDSQNETLINRVPLLQLFW